MCFERNLRVLGSCKRTGEFGSLSPDKVLIIMAKKKKKKKGQKPARSKAVRQGDPQKLLVQQREALAEMRGRRAQVLGERIYAVEGLDEDVRCRALASGMEAYLRELLAKGHGQQVRVKATKLTQQYPWLTEFWAQSLLVRLGIVQIDSFADVAAMQRLRSELVDPEDLAGEECGELGEQARCLLQAWQLLEKEEAADALQLLKGIGRRSPLVDWRLFIQILSCLKQQDRAGAEAAFKRMEKNTPAWSAAQAALAEKEKKGVWSRRFEALVALADNGQLPTSNYPRVQSLAKQLLADGRPGLAGSVVLSIGAHLDTQYSFESLARLMTRVERSDFNMTRLLVRMLANEDHNGGLFHPEMSEAMAGVSWTLKEERFIWGRFFRDGRQFWSRLKLEGAYWEMEELREEVFDLFVKICRRLAKRGQQSHDLYEFWLMMMEEWKESPSEAAVAYARAYPDDMTVQKRVICMLGDAGDVQGLQKIERAVMSCPEELTKPLEQLLLFYKIKAAFLAKDVRKVAELAAKYDSGSIQERIQVMIMQWRTAKGAEKRRCGVCLAEINKPFQVLCFARELVETLSTAALPAAFRRSLENDYDAFINDFLEWVPSNEDTDLFDYDDPVIASAFKRALNGYEGSLSVIRHVIHTILFKITCNDTIVEETEGMYNLFQQMLKGEGDDLAAALALRPVVAEQSWIAVCATKAERTFRVAWTLAESDEVRHLIQACYDECGFDDHFSINKKPATKKMLQDELKRQRGFKSYDQVIKCYQAKFVPWDRPVGGLAMEEIDRKLREIIGGMEDLEDDDDWEEEEESQRPSRPFDFGPHAPTMEFEYEVLITAVCNETAGQHRLDAAEALLRMIDESQLSTKAKKRLHTKCQQLIEGA